MLTDLLTRRNLLKCMAGMLCDSLLLGGEAPTWLKSVTSSPGDIPEPKRKLSSLLVDETGEQISNVEQWEKRATELQLAWRQFLKPLDREKRPAHEFEIVSRETVGNVIREKITYLVEEDIRVPAYLLSPKHSKPHQKHPGVVALHPTTSETIEPIAGLSGPPEKQSGLHLAEAGFVVLCPENFLWQNVANYKEAVSTFQVRHPGSLGMSKMLWDAQRAVDILQSVSGVDVEQIGTFGHSLGAKEVLYLMAFDERIKVGVFSEGGIAFDSTNWDAPWYLGQGINDEDFPLNHHQLLALCAPRPFLLMGGESGSGAADGDRSWPYVSEAQSVYELFGKKTSLALFNHRQGHAIPQIARERMVEWLKWGIS